MASELCGVCAEPIATGDDEPASGLCPTCDERDEADRKYREVAEAALWRTRDMADERRGH